MRALAALIVITSIAHAEERGLKVVGDDKPPLTIKLSVAAQTGGTRRTVAPNDTLKSGDRVELFVEVDRVAWVYVAQIFPDRTSAILGDALQLMPGASTRMPPAGKWFELDRTVGEETIVVVASTEPLERADKEARRALDEVRQNAAPKARKKPAALSLRTRGLAVVSEDSVTAKADARGVALFRFSFKHVN